MSKINGNRKGKEGEREWRDVLKAHGYDAARGRQFSGSPDSPDVVCPDLEWLHFEVKRVQHLSIYEAVAQAEQDAGSKLPIVAHRTNKRQWLITINLETFFYFVRHLALIKRGEKEEA
jgi:Holliday junction resolvase